MPAPTFRHICCAVLAIAAALPGCAVADSAGTYLTWQNKTSQTVESQGNEAAPAYPAPPSPYGQVGDPFRRNLDWPSKKTPQAPSRPAPRPEVASEAKRPYEPAHAQPAPAHPVETVASRPETPKSPVVQAVPTRPAPPILSVAKPVPAPHVPEHTVASVSTPTPLPAAKPVAVPPQVVAPQIVASAPKPHGEPVTASADDGYQVPATSKYAAQIKAARASQARDLARQAAGEASAPEPSEQLAVHETDRVFIPGETYKNEGDAPRLYSLHRMYGLQPDPITVSPDATGAILEGADLHADEAAPKTPARDTVKESGKAAKTKPEGK